MCCLHVSIQLMFYPFVATCWKQFPRYPKALEVTPAAYIAFHYYHKTSDRSNTRRFECVKCLESLEVFCVVLLSTASWCSSVGSDPWLSPCTEYDGSPWLLCRGRQVG